MVAEYYPRRRDPVIGVWAHRQARAARDAGAEVRVLALERPVPPVSALRAAARGEPAEVARSVRAFATQPAHELRDGIEMEIVRFVAPPRERGYATWDRWARPALERALRRLDAARPIDLIHAHYALPAGAAVRPWAAARGVPLVLSVHGGDVLGPALASPAARARVAETLRDAAAVVCNSTGTLRRAAQLTGSDERMRVVHLGAECPAGAADRERPAAFTIATLGHVVPRKRHADVLRALGRLPDLHWVVIGDGPELPTLRAAVEEEGLGGRVEFTGQLDPEAALRRLARCHLMALPSEDEAFGVAYVEALACGVPAVGVQGEAGPEEIAARGDGMLLVPPRDPQALAIAFAALADDRARWQALSDAARATAAEHFSWARCGRETVAAYEDALR